MKGTPADPFWKPLMMYRTQAPSKVFIRNWLVRLHLGWIEKRTAGVGGAEATTANPSAKESGDSGDRNLTGGGC